MPFKAKHNKKEERIRKMKLFLSFILKPSNQNLKTDNPSNLHKIILSILYRKNEWRKSQSKKNINKKKNCTKNLQRKSHKIISNENYLFLESKQRKYFIKENHERERFASFSFSFSDNQSISIIHLIWLSSGRS